MNDTVAVNLEDQMFLDRAIGGDTQALEGLIVAHHQRVVAYVQRLFPEKLNGWMDISDIVQETYTTAFRKIRHFRPEGNNCFYRWLATIARSRIADQLKAAQSFKRHKFRFDPAHQATSNLLNRLAVYKRTPSQSAADRELLKALERSIELLPEDYRQVIRLRHHQQLSPPQAARRMNRSVGATQMIYIRAIKSLREKLL